MQKNIKVGIIGANMDYGWGGRAHIPAILGLPEYELLAIASSNQDSANETAKRLGVPFAYGDYRNLIANPDVDLVSVTVKAPLHYEMTMASLMGGKPTFTEWPLGTNVMEATKMMELAEQKSIPTMVGLQSRVSPGIQHIRHLIDNGFVGDPLSCSMTMFLTNRPRFNASAWGADKRKGANTLTIHAGHAIDALSYCLGKFSELSSYVRTQVPVWNLKDSPNPIHVTSPDNVIVSGILETGCVVSMHIASTRSPAPGWKLHVFGTQGTIVATSTLMLQYGNIKIKGAKLEDVPDSYTYVGEDSLIDIPIPDSYRNIPDTVPSGWPSNIAELYRIFSNGLIKGTPIQPDFQAALTHHKLLDVIVRASETGAIEHFV